MSENPRYTMVMTEFCLAMAKQTLIDISTALEDMPIEQQHKTTALLTIVEMMLTLTLDALQSDDTPEERLKKKLEFLRIMKVQWADQARREKKEKSDDNG